MARVYTYGDTPYIVVEHEVYTFATDTWALTNPSSIKVTIKDPNGDVKVDDQGMTLKATGKYEYLYTLPESPVGGWWTGYVDVTNEDKPDRQWFGFTVKI